MPSPPQSCALVSLNNDFLFTPAFIVGLLGSGAMFAYCIKRTIDTSECEAKGGAPGGHMRRYL